MTSRTSRPGARRRHPRRISAVILAFVLSLGSSRVPAQGLVPADLAITDVSIVDVLGGRVLAGQTVLVAGDSIVRIVAAGGAVPPARVVVDGRGGYLIPGLWDMHAHLRADGVPAWVTTDWLMPLLLAHGVTGVRDMASGCDGPERGPVCLEQLRGWQAEIEAGDRLGPRLLALSSFPMNPPWDYEVTEDQARGLVRMLHGQGVRHIKVYHRLGAEALRWVLDEAARHDMTAWGHVPMRVTVREAAALGFRSVEHARDLLFDCFPGSAAFRAGSRSQEPPIATMQAMVTSHEAATCQATFAAMVEHGTWYVPTHLTRRMEAFAGDSAFRHDPRGRFIPPVVMDAWVADADRVVARDPSPAGRAAYLAFYRKGLELTGAAHRAGVRVLLGTDGGDSFVFPGSGVHDELEELVAAGLSPAEALRAATLSGAEFLGLEARHGSVQPGKRADLVLLGGNPLEDPAHVRDIRAVVLGGQWLDRAHLDALLQGAEAAARRELLPTGGGS